MIPPPIFSGRFPEKTDGASFPRWPRLGAWLLLVGFVTSAPSRANTWIGNTDANLATIENWTAAPVSGDNWSFGAAGLAGTALNNNLAAGFTVNGLAFANGASNYSLSGNAISLSNHLSVGTGSQNQVVNLDIHLEGVSRQINIQNGSVLTLNGVITGSALNLNGVGGGQIGRLILTNINTFTGNVTISQGTLEVGRIGNQGSTTSNMGAGTTVTIGGGANPAILNYVGSGETTNRNIVLVGNGVTHVKNNGSGALVWNGIIGNGSTTAARTITLGGTNADANTVGSVIADNGTGTLGVTKVDSGVWILAGNNTYSGATTINAGTLTVTGDSSGATGAVAVNAGGTLAGNGTIGGKVTVANSVTAVLAPGTLSGATETLALNNTNLILSGSNSQVKLDIAGTGAGDFDRIVGIDSFTQAGTVTFTLTGTYTTASWDVFDFAGKTGGFHAITLTGSYVGTLTLTDTDLWTGHIGGQDWTFHQATGVLTVVPEPATCLLTGLGLGLVLFRINRRRSP